jgi:hypothetical protein
MVLAITRGAGSPRFLLLGAIVAPCVALIAATPARRPRSRSCPAIIWLGSPWTGASLNPARSEGPALAFGDVHDVWVYFAAPCAEALVTGLMWRCNARRARRTNG